MTAFCMIFSWQKSSFLMFYPKNSLIQNFHSFFSFKSAVARFQIIGLQPKEKILLENYMMSGEII
jgi:hypothetical protein